MHVNRIGNAQSVDTDSAPASRKHSVRRAIAKSPFAVFGFVLILYLGMTVAAFASGSNADDFALVSRHFAHLSTVSSTISFGPGFHYNNGVGYDGQFCFFIALDPQNARFYIDTPAYRYTRILYPMTARALALGQPALIPYTLILVNLIAISGAVLLLAYWLRRHQVSPWLALFYGLFSGVLVAFQRDLTEPLGYGLVVLAICCFDFTRWRVVLSGLIFGLAALAREATLVFAAVYIVARLFEERGDSSLVQNPLAVRAAHNWRPALLMTLLAVGPFVAYKLFLVSWLGAAGTPGSLFPSLIPFSGILALLPVRSDDIMAVVIVCVPGLVCFALSLWALVRRQVTREIWALLLNSFVFVVMLRPIWYVDTSAATTRIATGVVLAALLSIPTLDRVLRRDRRWLAVCGPTWLAYTLLAVPIAVFTLFHHP